MLSCIFFIQVISKGLCNIRFITFILWLVWYVDRYSCELCDYQTIRKNKLERHQDAHNGKLLLIFSLNYEKGEDSLKIVGEESCLFMKNVVSVENTASVLHRVGDVKEWNSFSPFIIRVMQVVKFMPPALHR